MVDPEVRALMHQALDAMIDGCDEHDAVPELIEVMEWACDVMKEFIHVRAHLDRSDAAETN